VSSVAFTRPYARAFLESAPPGHDLTKFFAAAESLVAALESNAALRAFLRTPAVPREAKSRAVQELSRKAGLDEYGSRFLQVMLKNHRLLEAGQVLKALRNLNDERQGILRVSVTVPTAISEEERKAIEDAIAARTGKTVKTHIDIDAKLLGGFVARAGSNVFDGSVAAAIRMFQEQMKERVGA
jgi:F-type H+-transporting ATPase subunit delta